MQQRFSRPGLTMVELMLAATIMGVMALMVSGMVVSTIQGRERTQDDLLYQQDLASLLTQFSQDVRAGSGLVYSEPAKFRVRHAKRDGSFTYVSYRLTGGKLERGESAGALSEPGTYQPLLDPTRLKVTQGTFGYYELGNKAAAQTATMRRIEIRNFQVQGAQDKQHVKTPVISAVMREGANARSLLVVGSGGAHLHGHVHGANAWQTGAVQVDIPIRNIGSTPATFNAFSATWASGGADNPIKSMGVGSADWRGDYANGSGVESLGNTVTLAPGATDNIDLKLHKVSGKTDTLALMFYTPTDTARRDPYIVLVAFDD